MRSRVLMIAVLAALGAVWYFTLPPRVQVQTASAAGLPPGLRGAIHVHTNRSDGTGAVGDIATAAARAGLDFVVFTDHGDGTREPDPPQYRDGVLCIDAVEISTNDGHVIALGLSAAPYPLGGEGRDVVDDIARLGGFAIAAHPESLKAELRWNDWTLPVDGLEWLNGDSEWRDESPWLLARALFTYPVRSIETLAGLLDRPESTLRRWDMLTQQRRVVAVAGSDAHARMGLRSLGEPYENTASLRVPSYEQLLRVFSNVLPQTSLTGDPVADARSVLAAIRDGHVYSAIDALGTGAALSFTADAGKTRAAAGDVMPVTGPVTLRVDVPGVSEARIELLKDGIPVRSGTAPQLEHMAGADAPGVYRVEISLAGAPGQPPVPWMLSNPIYVGRDSKSANPAKAYPPASAFSSQYRDGPATGWTLETSPASLAALDVVSAAAGTELALRYALGGAASTSPFAALAVPAGPALASHDRLVFTARADRPTRISVQLRTPAGDAGERWHRSVFVDTEPREVTVYFDDLRPIGATTQARPTLANVDSVLFVFDTVNTPLGGSGRIWMDDVKYGR